MPPSTVYIDVSLMAHQVVDPPVNKPWYSTRTTSINSTSSASSSKSPLQSALKRTSKTMRIRGHHHHPSGSTSSGTLSTATQDEDFDDSPDNSIVQGRDDGDEPPFLSQRCALNCMASSPQQQTQTPPIPSVVLSNDKKNDDYDDDHDYEIIISPWLMNSIDVDERRIRGLQQAQRVAQEERQRLLERAQEAQIDRLCHDLYQSQQTTRELIDINVCLANKLALFYREEKCYEPADDTEALKEEEEHCQYKDDDVSSNFLFPVVQLCLGFGMVLLLSRGQALFPAMMIVWLWWLKESFF